MKTDPSGVDRDAPHRDGGISGATAGAEVAAIGVRSIAAWFSALPAGAPGHAIATLDAIGPVENAPIGTRRGV